MADFGAQLREARERKGISLRQIAASTKISVVALEGLERNDVSKLPGGIFSRAFVRSYAIEVGLDPDETVKQFLERFGGELPPAVPFPPSAGARPVVPPRSAPAPISRPAPAVPRPVPAPPDAGGINDEVDFESKQRMAGVVLKLVLVSLPIAAAIIYFGSRSPMPAGDASGRPASAAAAPSETAATAVEEAAGRPEGTAAAPPPSEAAQASPPSEAAPPSSPGVPAPTPVGEQDPEAITLEILPTSDCWAKLTVDGEVVLSRLIPAGGRESHRFRQTALLQVGDAAACAIALNGRMAKPLGRGQQVREINLTRENYRSYLP
ncbi:MAG: DUF4115 domain-containing protein [Acidobacteria bacterium]|nr:DUF4115 domain-containing protein [Acidobacteriota bacterium]